MKLTDLIEKHRKAHGNIHLAAPGRHGRIIITTTGRIGALNDKLRDTRLVLSTEDFRRTDWRKLPVGSMLA